MQLGLFEQTNLIGPALLKTAVSYYDQATPFHLKLCILELADLAKLEKTLCVLKFVFKELSKQSTTT